MRNIIIGLLIILALGAGCALSQMHPPSDDICVMRQTGSTFEKLCKTEAKYLPADFPDDLFVRWFSWGPHEQAPIAWTNEKVYELAWYWGGSNGDVVAAMHVAVLPGGHLAWAFVEFTSVAEIVWISTEATGEQRLLIEGLVEAFNKQYQNKTQEEHYERQDVFSAGGAGDHRHCGGLSL